MERTPLQDQRAPHSPNNQCCRNRSRSTPLPSLQTSPPHAVHSSSTNTAYANTLDVPCPAAHGTHPNRMTYFVPSYVLRLHPGRCSGRATREGAVCVGRARKRAANHSCRPQRPKPHGRVLLGEGDDIFAPIFQARLL